MGMFDEVRCEAPLPDGLDAAGVVFQTKTFPEPLLNRFTITADGRLLDSPGNDWEPDGYATFCGEDSQNHGREYRAPFVKGRLERIVGVTGNEPDNVCFGLASFRWHAPTVLTRELGGKPCPR